MSRVREKGRIVSQISKSTKELRGLDDKVKKAREAVNSAQNSLLRLQQIRDRVQDRLDDALNFYDNLEDEPNG